MKKQLLTLILLGFSTATLAVTQSFTKAETALKEMQSRLHEFPREIKYKIPSEFPTVESRIAAGVEASAETSKVRKARASFLPNYKVLKEYLDPKLEKIKEISKTHKEIHFETISDAALNKYTHNKYGMSYGEILILQAQRVKLFDEMAKRDAVIEKQATIIRKRILTDPEKLKSSSTAYENPTLSAEELFTYLKELLPSGNCSFKKIELVDGKNRKEVKITFMHEEREKTIFLGRTNPIEWTTYPINSKPEEFKIRVGDNVSNFFHLEVYPNGKLKSINMKKPATWESIGPLDAFVTKIGNPLNWQIKSETKDAMTRYECTAEAPGKISNKAVQDSGRSKAASNDINNSSKVPSSSGTNTAPKN